MTAPRLLRHRVLPICGPALGIALAYNFVFYIPLGRTLKSELARLHKLEAVSSRRSNAESNAEKLATAQAELRTLNEQLAGVNEVSTHLVARRADLRNEYLQSSTPASLMSDTLSLLSKHGLECIDSSPVSTPDRAAVLSESLKPVAELLAGTAGSPNSEMARREMRVTLRGRFQDLQSALREMQVAPLGIFTVSLEMETSDVHTDIRIWILTIAV